MCGNLRPLFITCLLAGSWWVISGGGSDWGPLWPVSWGSSWGIVTPYGSVWDGKDLRPDRNGHFRGSDVSYMGREQHRDQKHCLCEAHTWQWLYQPSRWCRHNHKPWGRHTVSLVESVQSPLNSTIPGTVFAYSVPTNVKAKRRELMLIHTITGTFLKAVFSNIVPFGKIKGEILFSKLTTCKMFSPYKFLKGFYIS